MQVSQCPDAYTHPDSDFESDSPSDDDIRSLLDSELKDNVDLIPLKGFRINLSANAGFRKFFYAAKCDCGTAALLSVEMDARKNLCQIEKMTPELVRRLVAQAAQFRKMSCEDHGYVRMGQTRKSKML